MVLVTGGDDGFLVGVDLVEGDRARVVDDGRYDSRRGRVGLLDLDVDDSLVAGRCIAAAGLDRRLGALRAARQLSSCFGDRVANGVDAGVHLVVDRDDLAGEALRPAAVDDDVGSVRVADVDRPAGPALMSPVSTP